MLDFLWPFALFLAPEGGGGGGGGDGDPDDDGGGDRKGPEDDDDADGSEGDEDEDLQQDDKDPYADLTPAQLKARLKDREGLVSKLRKESKSRRLALQKLEKAEDKRKKAEMTEVEKAQSEAKESADRADTAEAQLKALQIERVVEQQAIKLGVKRPELALRLMDLEEIDIDDEGEVDEKAVAKELKALLKDVPELLGKSKPDLEGEEGERGPGELEIDEAEIRSTFGLRPMPANQKK